jgi:hypothetical protein
MFLPPESPTQLNGDPSPLVLAPIESLRIPAEEPESHRDAGDQRLVQQPASPSVVDVHSLSLRLRPSDSCGRKTGAAGADQPPLLSVQPYFAQSSGFRLRPSVSGFRGAGT